MLLGLWTQVLASLPEIDDFPPLDSYPGFPEREENFVDDLLTGEKNSAEADSSPDFQPRGVLASSKLMEGLHKGLQTQPGSATHNLPFPKLPYG